MKIMITNDHIQHHLQGDLQYQPVSSPMNPDGIFYSLKEKYLILKLMNYDVEFDYPDEEIDN